MSTLLLKSLMTSKPFIKSYSSSALRLVKLTLVKKFDYLHL